MPRKEEKPPVQEWFNSGFKGLVVCISSLIVFSYQQLNGTMKDLTSAIRSIEIRVTSIEVDRASNKEDYRKWVQDVADLKMSVSQLNARVQTMSDAFVAKHFK